MWLVDSLSNKMCLESSCGGGDTKMKDDPKEVMYHKLVTDIVEKTIKELSLVEKFELIILIAKGGIVDIKKAEKSEDKH